MSAAVLTPEQQEFQEYARRWLAENAPPPAPERLPITPIEVMTTGQRDYLQAWQRKCYDAGLVGADYPTEYGGGGHEGFQAIANRELGRARVPFLINIVGLNMAAPTILVHGTHEQKKKFIPGCLTGEEIWCQGFSEPGAGSDMANQQTSAVRDGEDWIVNGHKVWTSLGHFAKWMILIARTSKEHKYDGLTGPAGPTGPACILTQAMPDSQRRRGPRSSGASAANADRLPGLARPQRAARGEPSRLMTRPILIAGSIGSPYTRKMKALAVYRRISYRFLPSMPGVPPAGLPKPPRPLLPCVYVPEGDEAYRATSDSTFQLRELERLYSGRSVIPSDPVVAFLDYLVEDYGDEWVTKMMFHYRWGAEEGVENASKILPLWNLTVPDTKVQDFRKTFAQRQIDRLGGVVAGSLDVTGPLIEASYARLIAILRDHFHDNKFTFGRRPSAGDFALHGQLTQLVQVEPPSMALARAEAPRLLAWVDVVDDLSGLEVTEQDWLPRDGVPDTLRALFTEIGRTYAPFMVANAAALEKGVETMEFQLDGVRYWQRPFPYQRKCLTWLRDEYGKLSSDDRAVVDGVLADTGCDVLFS